MADPPADLNIVLDINDVRAHTRIRARNAVLSPAVIMRDRLFHALFYRIALIYTRSIPRWLQRVLEFVLLFEALVALTVMMYVHFVYVREPVNCLQNVVNVWPADGILRVEIIKNASKDYSLIESYKKDIDSIHDHEKSFVATHLTTANTTDLMIVNIMDPYSWYQHVNTAFANIFKNIVTELKMFASFILYDETFIVEYSHEFGFLRMSPKTRERLNLTVMLVVLDPLKDECFGNSLSRFMLDEFLGYEDVVMLSLMKLAEKQNHFGFYYRNVITGEQYRFVASSNSRFSYLTAAFLMILFTLSVSMLLRYLHHQIFTFMVDLFHAFNRSALIIFPFAPLLTAILALIGVEALMSELFTEASTAFYVILIIWLADQYDVVCCHTSISRTHWLRFFYLYHFVFYAYHYRFNGHFSAITLATSWLFIQHSMIYFFHHYELPAIIHQAQMQRILIHAHRRFHSQGQQVNPAARPPESTNSEEPGVRVVSEEPSSEPTEVQPSSWTDPEEMPLFAGSDSTSENLLILARVSVDIDEQQEQAYFESNERQDEAAAQDASTPEYREEPVQETGRLERQVEAAAHDASTPEHREETGRLDTVLVAPQHGIVEGQDIVSNDLTENNLSVESLDPVEPRIDETAETHDDVDENVTCDVSKPTLDIATIENPSTETRTDEVKSELSECD